MANLSHEGSLQFWKEFMGGSIYEIVDFIEQTEDWVASDDPKVEEAMKNLSEFFDQATSKNEFSHQDLIQICAYIYLSQKLSVMQTLDNIQPGLATHLIQTAESAPKDDDASSTFLKRNVIFERMRILSRVLDPERIQLVQRVYES